ncbi:MFS transporter [Peribacillus sp. TH24]|uniref:MFS transporter n=1 Tax=Peribacillus sp. TH24 TaxID=2798483 RepID=UPI0019142C34|nr:MFS transporter [Peribacillus sp. TH24]MBK5443317.1 MFS transporter [Peribacillus sp. TH24]
MALLFVGYMVSYMDRLVMNLALVPIGQEFHLSPTATGTVISVFFLAYTIMQIPAGWLTDRLGYRRVIIFSVVLWSFFTVFTGFAWSFTALIVIRFLFGIMEGGYPAASAKAISEFFPKKERGKAQSILMSSNSVGGLITSLLVPTLLIWLGWRNVFFALGAAGVIIGVLFWKYIRSPIQSEEAKEQQPVNKESMLSLLKTRQTWALVLTWFSISIASWGTVSWLPMYMVTVRHLDLVSAGMLSVIPTIGATLGTAAGGWLLVRFSGREKMYFVMNGLFYTALLFLALFAPNVGMVFTYLTLASIFYGFVFSAVYALPHKLFDKSVIGSAIGIMSLGSMIGGFIAPIMMGVLISALKGSYDGAFWFLIAAGLSSALFGLTIRNSNHVFNGDVADQIQSNAKVNS